MRATWTMAHSVAAGERIIIAAADAQQRLVGTVQLVIDQPENQPHRADVAKMLVSRRARRQGIAAKLLAAADLKDGGAVRSVVAVGCMAERYGNELASSMPEADAVQIGRAHV